MELTVRIVGNFTNILQAAFNANLFWPKKKKTQTVITVKLRVTLLYMKAAHKML